MKTLERFLSVFLFTAVLLFSSVALLDTKAYAQSVEPQTVSPLRQNEPLIEQQSKLVIKKADKLSNTSKQIQDLKTKKETLSRQLADEKKTIDGLNQQIANKKAAEEAAKAQAVQQVSQPTFTAPVPNVVSGCGDNTYANFIYMHESGCNTGARNAGGCLGIGQACPGSKLLAVCPSLDYACENAFFTAYANKYGGWAGSYSFWIAHGWW